MRCLSRKHEPLMGDALTPLPYKNRFKRRKIIQNSRPSKLDYVQTRSIIRIKDISFFRSVLRGRVHSYEKILISNKLYFHHSRVHKQRTDVSMLYWSITDHSVKFWW